MGAFSVVDLFLQRRQDGTTTGGGGPTGGGTTGGEGTPTGGGTTGGGGATSPGGGTTVAGDPSPTGGSTGSGDSPPGGDTAGGTGTDAPPTGGATSPPVGGGTTAPPDGGTETPGGTATAPGGGTATLTDGGSNTSGAGTAIPTDGGSNTSGAETGTPTDGGSNTSEAGTGTPTDGGSNTSGAGTSTPPLTTTTPGGGTTTTAIPLPATTTRRTSWDVTSTWCPPELSRDPQYAAQPTFTGTTVIDGTSWVQTTLDAPLTTVYTTESIYTEHGQAMTKYIPVTTVIPPGTVVIRHNLTVGKKSSKVPIVAGALGGVAALILIGALAFFLVKRRQRREAARNLRIDIDPTSAPTPSPPYPGLPPLMSETTGNSQLLQPSATGSTNYGGVVGSQYNATVYGATSRPSMDTASMGGASSMHASTNYGRSTSPNIVGAQQMHYRSPSAASGGSVPIHQVPPSMTSHVSMAHYRAESGSTPIGIVQEEDPLLGPFSDSNRVPTPSSVMPLVHEDAGSIRNAEVGVWSPPAYDGAGAARM